MPHGEAKFWLEPRIVIAKNAGFSTREIHIVRKIIEERADDITRAWHRHFSG